jgi:hypothetical protein
MNPAILKLFTQPVWQAFMAAAVVGATATLMGRNAETKAAKIPVESPKTRRGK